MSHPPSAEQYLHHQDRDSQQFAPGMTQLEVKSPVVEQKRTYHTLHHIVGQRHAAIGHDATHESLEAGAIESKQHACDEQAVSSPLPDG